MSMHGAAVVRKSLTQQLFLLFPFDSVLTRLCAAASGTLLAREAGHLVVPVAHNAGTYWPRRGLFKKSGTIRLVIGPPIDPKGADPREVNERVQRWIESKIATLS